MKDYEEYLQKALAEGWKDPIQITNLEIKAYDAGVLMERKRVLSILSKAVEGKPMRILDLLLTMDSIKNPNQ